VTNLIFGSVPKRPKGADCKSVGSAYGGSNPPAPTILCVIKRCHPKNRGFPRFFSFYLRFPRFFKNRYFMQTKRCQSPFSPPGVDSDYKRAFLRADSVIYFTESALFLLPEDGRQIIFSKWFVPKCSTNQNVSNINEIIGFIKERAVAVIRGRYVAAAIQRISVSMSETMGKDIISV
jgi:hypothetical protein